MFSHQIPEVLKYLPVDTTILFLGPPGVGKTSGVYEYEKQTGIPVYEDSLVNMLPEDVKGCPDLDRERDETRWRPPGWWRRFSYHILEGEPDKKVEGVIFLDEAMSAAPTVQVTAQKIAQERQLGFYKLHPNVRVILAGNRKEDGALVSTTPAPLRTKLITLTVEPDLDIWIEHYARPNKLNHTTVQFLRFRQELFCDSDPSKYGAVGGMPNGRSWTTVSRLQDLRDKEKKPMPEWLFIESVQGSVGEGPAAEYLEFGRFYDTLPAKEEIEKNPDNANMEKEGGWLYAMQGWLVKQVEKDKSFIDAALKYLKRAPRDLRMYFLSDVLTLGPQFKEALRNAKTFSDYASLVRDMLRYDTE